MNKLSIIIPTWNRSPFLSKLLELLYTYEQKGLYFDLIVCNNASTDDTKEVIAYWKDKFHVFKIVNQKSNVGYDRNVASGFSLVTTDYYWITGDSYYMDYHSLLSIVNLLSTNKYEAIIVKTTPRLSIKTKTYCDINILMSEQGWHITNLSSCFISSKFLNQSSIERYFDSNFVHLGVFVEYLCSLSRFCVHYIDSVIVDHIVVDNFSKQNWASKPFGVFAKNWFEVIMSLPIKVNIENKKEILLDHNKYTGIFDLPVMIKSQVVYSRPFTSDYRHNRRYLKYVSTTPIIVYDLVSLIPQWVGQVYFALCGLKNSNKK